MLRIFIGLRRECWMLEGNNIVMRQPLTPVQPRGTFMISSMRTTGSSNNHIGFQRLHHQAALLLIALSL